jgi:hypothetical protein
MKKIWPLLAVVFVLGVAEIAAPPAVLAQTDVVDAGVRKHVTPKASIEGGGTTKPPTTPRTSFQTTETRSPSKGTGTVPKTSFQTTETRGDGGN